MGKSTYVEECLSAAHQAVGTTDTLASDGLLTRHVSRLPDAYQRRVFMVLSMAAALLTRDAGVSFRRAMLGFERCNSTRVPVAERYASTSTKGVWNGAGD